MLRQAIDRRAKAEGRAQNMRAALVAAMVYNMAGKVSKTKLRPSDLLGRKPPTPEQFHAKMMGWATAHNATIEA